MSLYKAVKTGLAIGEVAGPEGELVGAGVAAAISVASSLYNRYHNSESKESQPLLSRNNEVTDNINRPGIANIHAEGLRQRSNVARASASGEFVDVPLQDSRPRIRGQNGFTVRSIDRYGRRPVLTKIAIGAGTIGTIATASTTSKQVKVTPPADPLLPTTPLPTVPEPPIQNQAAPLEHMPGVMREAPPAPPTTPQLLSDTELANGVVRPRGATRSLQIGEQFVGNYRFPTGPYNYVNFDKFTRNDTIKSLS